MLGRFVVIKVGHVITSIAANVIMGTGEGWLVLFPIQMMALHVWMITVPFRCVAVDPSCAPSAAPRKYLPWGYFSSYEGNNYRVYN